MSAPPADLLKQFECSRRQRLENSNDLWQLQDVVTIKNTEVLAVILRVTDSGLEYLDSKLFPTTRAAREFVAVHNAKFEATRVRRPLPQQRPPTVIDINNGTVVQKPVARDDDNGWFDESRDYRKPFSEDFEIDEGSNGSTVTRYKGKRKVDG